MTNWWTVAGIFVAGAIGLATGMLIESRKTKRKSVDVKVDVKIDLKYGEILKSSNKNNKPKLLEGLLISDIKTVNAVE